MLEKATRLCEAASGILWTYDGSRFRAVAVHGATEEYVGWLHSLPDPVPSPSLARIASGEKIVRDDDLATAPGTLAYAHTLAGMRTGFLVALRKGDALLGAIRIFRQDPRPFSDKHIALLQNFAAQAVIAMENARLITETREALEQQTATADVLQVINSSPGDLAPVFDAILEKAHSLCGVTFGFLQLYDSGKLRAVALRGVPEAVVEPAQQGFSPSPNHPIRGLLDGVPYVHIGDLAEIDDPAARRVAQLGGIRTSLFVALRKDGTLLGMISAGRKEIRPFADKQIALLQNFAAQAVIAMENARLMNETREALEQQTATAEVLGVINSSPGDLIPVFDVMLDKAISLSDSVYGHLLTYDGEFFDRVAVRGNTRMVERQSLRRRAESGITLERIVRGEPVVQIADVMDTDAYRSGNLAARVMVDEGDCRTLLTVALRKEDILLGTLSVYRRGVRPFSGKQIALLQNFAAQAVIAMENARLITETREALEQQTATSEVLQVINASPGDLKPVFEAMLEKATSLCGADLGNLLTYSGECFEAAVGVYGSAWIGPERELSRAQIRPVPGGLLDRLVAGEHFIHTEDVRTDIA